MKHADSTVQLDQAFGKFCKQQGWVSFEQELTAVIEGTAAKISKAEALKYFATRPRGSQIGAWISRQSSVITTRALLEQKFEQMKTKLANREVPLPDKWGGYRVTPKRFEFWQGRPNRLHDRFQYLPDGERWSIDRLAP